MSFDRHLSQAGPSLGLPFFLLLGFLLTFGVGSCAAAEALPVFQEFESSCIDLGRYDEKSQQLTVRFVNRNPERFYRYSNVPKSVWEKLNELNDTGGVGNYLNETIVQVPQNYPFKELTIRKFKTIPKTKKPKIQYESPAF